MAHSTIVRNARESDLPSWQELAAEVEPLFGPMPDIAGHIRRGIARGTALVAEDTDRRFAGAALLSRDGQPHSINWLAVRADARRRGVGASLTRAILTRWDDGEPIHVVTFGADNPDGAGARALYAAYGFQFDEHTENGPEGGRRERWIKR